MSNSVKSAFDRKPKDYEPPSRTPPGDMTADTPAGLEALKADTRRLQKESALLDAESMRDTVVGGYPGKGGYAGKNPSRGQRTKKVSD